MIQKSQKTVTVIDYLVETNGFALQRAGNPLLTPRKNPLTVPTEGLAEKVAAELSLGKGFNVKTMPFTAIAYSALDILPQSRERMIEAMLAYVETDLLCYRSDTPNLQKLQAEGWDPVISWAKRRWECHLEVTSGLMPVTQPEDALSRFRQVMESFDDFTLAAFSVLVQVYGSLLLALAVKENEMTAQKAFALSRIDEAYQAEQWGEDSLAIARLRELERDALAAGEFLTLLS